MLLPSEHWGSFSILEILAFIPNKSSILESISQAAPGMRGGLGFCLLSQGRVDLVKHFQKFLTSNGFSNNQKIQQNQGLSVARFEEFSEVILFGVILNSFFLLPPQPHHSLSLHRTGFKVVLTAELTKQIPSFRRKPLGISCLPGTNCSL